MSLYAIVLIAALLTLTLYGIIIHKALAELRRSVAQAWLSFDALIRQRHDLVPDLRSICERHAAVSGFTLQRIMDARSQVLAAARTQDATALAGADVLLREGMSALFMEAARSATLRDDPAYLSLKEHLETLASAILEQAGRYDARVDLHNARIEQFPDVVVARMLEVGIKTVLRLRPPPPTEPIVPAPAARSSQTA